LDLTKGYFLSAILILININIFLGALQNENIIGVKRSFIESMGEAREELEV
jgi:hypothetical protein